VIKLFRRARLEKKDVCKVDPKDLLNQIKVNRIENSKKCIIEFDGKTYIAKTCKEKDILEKIRKDCGCACERKISL